MTRSRPSSATVPVGGNVDSHRGGRFQQRQSQLQVEVEVYSSSESSSDETGLGPGYPKLLVYPQATLEVQVGRRSLGLGLGHEVLTFTITKQVTPLRLMRNELDFSILWFWDSLIRRS